ncbi:MAG: hypothetical protein HOH74_04995, partial [Gemmatimonadetes bacterium]|nr:hypothetical protein [Gemmatimonadota bacterium]
MRSLLRGFVVILGLTSAVPADVQFINTPVTSLTKARGLLDQVDLRVLLPLGFEQDTTATSVLANRPGVRGVRIYVKQGEAPVEIGLTSGAQGYDLALYRENPAHLDPIVAQITPVLRAASA